MDTDISTDQILSKIIIASIAEVIKYDLRKNLLTNFDPTEQLESMVGTHALGNAIELDEQTLAEFHSIRDKMYHAVDDLLIFNFNFDLTKDKYQLSKIFLSMKASFDGERGEVFQEAFVQSYQSMILSSKYLFKETRKTTDEVMNFLSRVRVINPWLFDYLGFQRDKTGDKPLYPEKFHRLIERVTQYQHDEPPSYLDAKQTDQN